MSKGVRANMKHMNQMATLGLTLGLAIAVAAAGAHALTQEADATSKAFIKTAIEGNNTGIDLGKRALSKGQSNAIKQFGQTLVTDRQKVNEEAKTAANAVGVKPPDATLVTIATLAKLNAQNRFALAFRLHNMKTETGRKKKIAVFVEMLKRGETIYPQVS